MQREPDQAPPPPPPPPVDREPGTPGRAAYAGAIALLVLVQLPQALIPASDPSVDGVPYRIGKSVGGFVFAIGIGYFVWWVVRRSRPPGTPKWSPWVFVIAAGVASLSLFGQLAQQGTSPDALQAWRLRSTEVQSSLGSCAHPSTITPASPVSDTSSYPSATHASTPPSRLCASKPLRVRNSAARADL